MVPGRAGVRLPWRHGRKLRRPSDLVHRETRLTVIKLDALEQLGELILAKIAGLSKEDAERGEADPAGRGEVPVRDRQDRASHGR